MSRNLVVRINADYKNPENQAILASNVIDKTITLEGRPENNREIPLKYSDDWKEILLNDDPNLLGFYAEATWQEVNEDDEIIKDQNAPFLLEMTKGAEVIQIQCEDAVFIPGNLDSIRVRPPVPADIGHAVEHLQFIRIMKMQKKPE